MYRKCRYLLPISRDICILYPLWWWWFSIKRIPENFSVSWLCEHFSTKWDVIRDMTCSSSSFYTVFIWIQFYLFDRKLGVGQSSRQKRAKMKSKMVNKSSANKSLLNVKDLTELSITQYSTMFSVHILLLSSLLLLSLLLLVKCYHYHQTFVH